MSDSGLRFRITVNLRLAGSSGLSTHAAFVVFCVQEVIVLMVGEKIESFKTGWSLDQFRVIVDVVVGSLKVGVRFQEPSLRSRDADLE